MAKLDLIVVAYTTQLYVHNVVPSWQELFCEASVFTIHEALSVQIN